MWHNLTIDESMELIRRTKVGEVFEEEKQAAIKEAVKEVNKELSKEMARSLLDEMPLELIAEKLGLNIDEVREINKEHEAQKRV